MLANSPVLREDTELSYYCNTSVIQGGYGVGCDFWRDGCRWYWPDDTDVRLICPFATSVTTVAQLFRRSIGKKRERPSMSHSALSMRTVGDQDGEEI